MTEPIAGEQEFVFDTPGDSAINPELAPWQVLIVDDEDDVHKATQFAMESVTVLGRTVEFQHAYSAAEAQIMLMQKHDFALALVDVVMETDTAGLGLIKFIRETLGNTAVRLILRTGQPGYAPEIDTIRDYDINDYKTKSELTRTKLYASITTGIRSYQQIIDLDALAYYDKLSNLPNRNRFIDLIEEYQEDHMSDSGAMTVYMVDIDDFSEVNNAVGHKQGDQLLQAVAQRLVDNMPREMQIARIGSDTFGMLLNGTSIHPEEVLALFIDPFRVGSDDMIITVSMGTLVIEGTTLYTGLDAVKDAGMALKAAKKTHRGGWVRYSNNMGVELSERMHLLQNLRAAVAAENTLSVAYQPQVQLSTGKVIGVEALMRWREVGGPNFIAPDKFIPLAEASGLIVPLGEWILRTSCFEQVRLKNAGMRIRMSVNVSQLQFRHPNFLDTLQRAIADSNIDPFDLELEITESVAMVDADSILTTLRNIKGLHISIAIDDFGTGYSSLSTLRLLPVDRLKIDRIFIIELDTPMKGYTAGTVIELAKNFELQVIAEGIETEDQAAKLVAMGCDEGQGYLYSKPLTSEALEVYLKSQFGLS